MAAKKGFIGKPAVSRRRGFIGKGNKGKAKLGKCGKNSRSTFAPVFAFGKGFGPKSP